MLICVLPYTLWLQKLAVYQWSSMINMKLQTLERRSEEQIYAVATLRIHTVASGTHTTTHTHLRTHVFLSRHWTFLNPVGASQTVMSVHCSWPHRIGQGYNLASQPNSTVQIEIMLLWPLTNRLLTSLTVSHSVLIGSQLDALVVPEHIHAKSCVDLENNDYFC